jgi:hypothetical protein
MEDKQLHPLLNAMRPYQRARAGKRVLEAGVAGSLIGA